jgi:hypothetical protein
MDSGIGRVSVGLPDTANEVQVVPTQGSIGQGPDEARPQRVETGENTYQYQPLLPGHIRCLVLYPGTGESDIEVSLVPFSLQDDPDSILKVMEALSYTWGVPTPAKKIRFRDEAGRTLAVSPNLHDALVGLRQTNTSRSDGRIMWIDQLCINQQDNDEKSEQVQMMGAIYSKASRVIIWLSKEVFHLKDVNFHLSKFRDLFNAAMTAIAEGSHPEGIEDERLSKAAKRISQHSWDIAQIVFGHPYFTRIWIIQEIVMAKQCLILLENGQIEWDMIRTIGATLSNISETLGVIPLPVTMKKPIYCLQNMITLRYQLVEYPKQGGSSAKIFTRGFSDPNIDANYKLGLARGVKSFEESRESLLDLAQLAWRFNASDRRDKIYALLGLLAFDRCYLGSFTELYPDYSSTKTYQQLLQDITTTSFTQHGSLSTLVLCNPRRNVRLPSWLFDVEDPYAADMPYALGRTKSSASGSKVGSVLANPDDASVLSFKITRIGALSRLSPVSVDELVQADLEQRREQDFCVKTKWNLGNIFEMVYSSWSTAIDAVDTITVPDGLLLKTCFGRLFAIWGRVDSGSRLGLEESSWRFLRVSLR